MYSTRLILLPLTVMAVVIVALAAPAWAQSTNYDLSWTLLCGPHDPNNPDQNVAAVYQGQMQIIVTQRTDGSGTTYWEARNASTGVFVFQFANEQLGVQELALPAPACGDVGYSGHFDWNPIVNADGFKTFTISDAVPESSRVQAVAYATAMKSPAAPPPPPPTAPTVTFGNLTGGQVVAGTYGVRMTANGLGAASYKWTISVDNQQVSYRIESSTSITFWWNTSGLLNGTHTLSVRVVDAAGKVATGRVNVVIRN